MSEEKKKKSMYDYCPECGELITNAFGGCHNCANEEQRWQEPPDYDEMADHDDFPELDEMMDHE